MNKRTVKDTDVAGKRVLVRVDFNVPIDPANGEILDDTRIRAALPTINDLRAQNARTILVSHLGRPDGKVVESARLAPVAARLASLLGVDVPCATDVVGNSARAVIDALLPGGVAMLENVRFEPGEEKNDPDLARRLAGFADVYVNDAFGAAHRAHASTAGVAAHLPAVAGFLMEKELEFLGRVVENPEPPVAAVIGGAKVSSKIGVLKHLLSKVNTIVIGGGMASTVLKAQGRAVGESLVEDDQLETAREIMREAERRGVNLGIPVDVVLGERFAAETAAKNADAAEIPDGWMILDIGAVTVEDYKMRLRPARTVVWNGPMGVAEWERFARGSAAIAEFLAGLDATVIIGGGETVAVVQALGIADRFDHVSTGGGASLEFLEGKELPGVVALLDR